MESIIEMGNCDQHQVHGLSSSFTTDTTNPTGLPKRFWNLQNFPEAQQRKITGSCFSEITGKVDRARLSMDVNDLPSLQCNTMGTEDEYIDQDQKHGLRRKAAKGLKRIMTHFSLSDVNSFSATPGLTSTSLSHHRHNQSPFNYDEENNLTSSEETSLDTLSTEMHDMLSETENEELEEVSALEHKPYRSRSHPALLMLSNITSLANRSLPPLPPAKLSAPLNVKIHALDEYHHLKEKMHQAQVEQKLRQAVHWCRKPFHKFMSSPVVSTIITSPNVSSSQLMIHDTQNNFSQSLVSTPSSSSPLNVNEKTTTTILSPRQEKNTYKALEKNQARQSWTHKSAPADKKFIDTSSHFRKKKMLRCRVIQITNTASSKEYHYELFVQLNDDIQASQSGTLKKITKGISAGSPKNSFSFEVSSPFSLAFTLCAKPVDSGFSKMKTFISKMDLAHQESTPPSPDTIQPNDCSYQFFSKMPVVGSTYLLSGEKFEAFSGKGVSRYTLIKPSQSKNQVQLDDLNLELMVAFQLEDLMPSEPIGLSGFCTSEMDFNDALASCQQGDYLTFYVRRQQFPIWNRYWVTLEHGQLYLRQFSNEHKGPIESIPLCELRSVCKPGEEIQEQVYFGRKHGIVLKFKTRHIQMDQTTLADNEKVEGYMYLFADSTKKASIWRTLFTAYASTEYITPNAAINARYLW